MRFENSREQEVYVRHASEAGWLELVFAGLDVLSRKPRKINRKVLDVVLEVWNSGRRFGKIPLAIPDETEPQWLENMGVRQPGEEHLLGAAEDVAAEEGSGPL